MFLNVSTGIESWLVEIFIGGGVIVSGLTLLVTRLVTKWTRSKPEIRSEDAKAMMDAAEAGKALLNLTEEELRIREANNQKAWSRVSKLEGIIDGLVEEGESYRRKLEEALKEISNIKIELLEVKEAKQIAEHHRDRYKTVLESMREFFVSCCPKDWEQYCKEHSVEDIYENIKLEEND